MAYLVVGLNPAIQKTLCFSSLVPDTVNRTGIHRLDIAGKGINITRVLTQLGKKAVNLTQLGGTMRPLFLSFSQADSLSVEWVESSSQIRFCYTLINDADSSVTELVEESEPVETGTEQRLLEKFDSLLYEGSAASQNRPAFKYIILSGTKAVGFSDKLIPLMVCKAKEKGLMVILDLRGKDLVESLKYRPDVIKPNLFEFAETFAPDLVKNNELAGDEALIKKRIKPMVLDMCREIGCRVILTRGSKKTWAAEGDVFFEVDVQAVKPVNTTGSGDAFTAGLASALGDGAGFKESILEGIRCGSLNAGFLKPGVIK